MEAKRALRFVLSKIAGLGDYFGMPKPTSQGMVRTEQAEAHEPRTVTREEFRRDPGAVMREAARGSVTVTDSSGRPRFTISGQSDEILTG